MYTFDYFYTNYSLRFLYIEPDRPFINQGNHFLIERYDYFIITIVAM